MNKKINLEEVSLFNKLKTIIYANAFNDGYNKALEDQKKEPNNKELLYLLDSNKYNTKNILLLITQELEIVNLDIESGLDMYKGFLTKEKMKMKLKVIKMKNDKIISRIKRILED